MRREAERIGILGGTFNPPHIGHLAAAGTAIRELALSRLLVIPAKDPPHKELPAGTPGPMERFRLTEAAFASLPEAEVLDLELRREGPSYTVDTLWTLREEYPGAVLYLIVGTDMFLTIHQWYQAEELLGLCLPAALSREEGGEAALYEQAVFLRERYGAECRILKHAVRELASTDIRREIAETGETADVPPEVLELIREKGYYREV